VKLPRTSAIPEGGFRPANDLLRFHDGFGGLDTTAGQDVRHDGITGLAFAPPHLLNERPITLSVADDQAEAGMLEPLLAVGRGRRDAAGEVGGGGLPLAAEREEAAADTPEMSVIRPELQERLVGRSPSRHLEGARAARRPPEAIRRQEIELL